MNGDRTISPSPSCIDVAAVAEAVEEYEERLERQASAAFAGLDLQDGLTDTSAAAALSYVIAAARRAAPDTVAASLLKTSAHFSSGDYISGQAHENDRAEVVIVCEPDLSANLMGALHPAGSLYERPVNMKACTQQHEAFRQALRSNGVRCLTVREILLYDTDVSVRARVELEDLAAGRLRYELDPSCDERLLSSADRFYIGDEYKKQVLECMSTDQLVDVVLTGPTVNVQPSFRDTGFTAAYKFEPLTNAQFTRDQQVTTAKGIVLARLRSEQRRHEVNLMKHCFEKLGMPVIGTIAHPGYLEGGDFFPAGHDLCFIGVGTRTNLEACHQLMQRDLLGTRRVAVVNDCFERDQARMHLDTLFNIVGDDVCLLAADVIGEHSPLRRTVDEYERVDLVDDRSLHSENGDSVTPPTPEEIDTDVPVTPLTRYVLRRSGVEFSKYLADNGFHIEPISREHQLEYGCNVLNLGDSTLLSCHAATARQIVRCPHFHGSVQLIEFNAVNSMYGSLHCSSQVVRRAPAAEEDRGGR